MADMRFTNVNTAVRGLLAELMGPAARQVAARGFQTRELGPIQFTLANPQQRCLILPERRNNIFASIAETIWVVSGRNDLAFLQHYLPRATDFSDDGTTWRAAYGPRLRNWAGVDQLAEVCRLLLGDADSRRAVMAIFDPARDYVASKDIPCNNWLHWLIRDGRLNCHVAIRSNDIIWGFSGINAFEWSVLQEILAYWVGVSIGEITYSVSSEHLYSHHYERAQQILAATSSDHDVYTATNLTRFAFATKWKDFSEVLDQWFAVEQTIRQNGEWQAAVDQFPDPLLQAFLRMLAVYWSAKREEPLEQTLKYLAPLAGSDLELAAREWLSRTTKGQVSFEFQQIFGSQTNAPAKPTSTAVAPAALFNRLQQTISRLHAIKTATYGNSWKRRGEILGIMANIARKVDRLGVTDGEVGKVYVAVAQGKKTLVDSETALDTAVDLLVYCLKYRTYLIDEGVADPPENYAGSTPLSDNTDGLDAVLAEAFDLQKTPIDGLAKALEPPAGLTAENLRLNRKIDVVTVAGLTEMAFAALEGIVIPAAASASPVLNQAKATALAELITNARNLVVAVAVACPDMVTALQRQVGLDHVEVEQS